MSNIYITEPSTEGKVLLHTSFGDLDVELWPQQAPKASRNFVQLCLEGYYDNTIFHRVIKDFMIQGGDPTGTGNGGESIYGEAFVDEFHTRLKFNHRGILAMANENKPNSNHSQFFFTLDACEFLNRKHTIFGKITGNTIFNLLGTSELDTDDADRPLNPPKILSTEVLWNPFDDIVPRDLKPRKTGQNDVAVKKKARKSTKDLNLLSFGDEEGEFQDEPSSKSKTKKKKMMSSHDLLDDKKLMAEVDEELAHKIREKQEVDDSVSHTAEDKLKKKDAIASLKAAVAAAARRETIEHGDKESASGMQAGNEDESKTQRHDKKRQRPVKSAELDEYTRLRDELKKSKKAIPLLIGDKSRQQDAAKAFHDMLTPLQQQRQKYLERKKASSRSHRQQETLKKLEQFKSTLHNAASSAEPNTDRDVPTYDGQVLEGDDEEAEGDGKDKSWMVAKLRFKKHIDDQFRNNIGSNVDDYTTIDSRDEANPDAKRPDNKTRGSRSRGRSRSRERSYRSY